MYAVFPELCNQLYVGYWKCPGLNDSSLLANSWLLLTPLSYFPYWIWQIFSIFQPQLILFADHTRNPMKKNQIWLTFNYFCDRFLIYHNKFQWKPQGYEKKNPTYSKMKQKTRSILF